MNLTYILFYLQLYFLGPEKIQHKPIGGSESRYFKGCSLMQFPVEYLHAWPEDICPPKPSLAHTQNQTMTGSLKITGPSSVTATECSKCADEDLSPVMTVQPSLRTSTSWPPILTIGSMAKTIPGIIRGE